MLKYDFAIQTRDGLKVASVVIAGRDQSDAERKLRQMYRHSDILRCTIKNAPPTHLLPGNSVEEILSLISK